MCVPDRLQYAVLRQMGNGRVVGKVLAELPGNSAGDLRHLQRMGQPGPVEIAVAQI